MHIVIIGNGISGITAARYLRKLSNHRISVISSESQHFYSRTALMYIYMGHMRYEDTKPYEDSFWKKNDIQLIHDHVLSVHPSEHSLTLSQGGSLSFDRLIIAAGSVPNRWGWKGELLNGVSGLYHLSDLDTIEAYSKNLNRAVIVGGGLIGIEMAEMFHSRNIPVTLLVRESSYWNGVLPPEESAMVNEEIKAHNIDLRLNSELQEILGDDTDTVKAVITKNGERINCGFVGLTAGVKPNIGFLEESGIETNKGILVNSFLQTNFPDIYAIGDCAQLREPENDRKAIEAVWYTGRMMGQTVAYNICEHAISYQPRLWFNSAKFFNIEYQIYGLVNSKPVEGIQHLFWQAPSSNQSIRIVFEEQSTIVLGFNLMGIRFRHEVCEKWLMEKANLKEVVSNIQLAFFEPEFYKTYESQIQMAYSNLTGEKLQVHKNSGWNAVYKFLKK